MTLILCENFNRERPVSAGETLTLSIGLVIVLLFLLSRHRSFDILGHLLNQVERFTALFLQYCPCEVETVCSV